MERNLARSSGVRRNKSEKKLGSRLKMLLCRCDYPLNSPSAGKFKRGVMDPPGVLATIPSTPEVHKPVLTKKPSVRTSTTAITPYTLTENPTNSDTRSISSAEEIDEQLEKMCAELEKRSATSGCDFEPPEFVVVTLEDSCRCEV